MSSGMIGLSPLRLRRFSLAANFVGLPAISLPVGHDSKGACPTLLTDRSCVSCRKLPSWHLAIEQNIVSGGYRADLQWSAQGCQ